MAARSLTRSRPCARRPLRTHWPWARTCRCAHVCIRAQVCAGVCVYVPGHAGVGVCVYTSKGRAKGRVCALARIRLCVRVCCVFLCVCAHACCVLCLRLFAFVCLRASEYVRVCVCPSEGEPGFVRVLFVCFWQSRRRRSVACMLYAVSTGAAH